MPSPPLARLRSAITAIAAIAVSVLITGCSHQHRPSTSLDDPCAVITDPILARLGHGGQRVPTEVTGSISATRTCAVDLTSAPTGMRGDLEVTVSVDGTRTYDARWRADRCREIGARLTSAGAGNATCFLVRPWDGHQSRVDGWAWLGDDRAAHVAYQVVAPPALPPSARRDLLQLLGAARATLPAE